MSGIDKRSSAANFHLAKIYPVRAVGTLHTNCDTTGSAVKCLVNKLSPFKIALYQCTNSHLLDVTSQWLAGQTSGEPVEFRSVHVYIAPHIVVNFCLSLVVSLCIFQARYFELCSLFIHITRKQCFHEVEIFAPVAF